MTFWLGFEARRKRLQRRALGGPVRGYLAQRWPGQRENLLPYPLFALDLETSGLDARRDDIVGVGWACIESGRILLSSAERRLVRPRSPLPAASVFVHGIGDDQAAKGQKLATVMTELLEVASGRILVGHHVRMDAAFLSRACENLGWGKVAFPCIDTLQLVEKIARQHDEPVAADGLSLRRVRERYALPEYPAHDALWDAIAAAELWLALGAEMAGDSGRVEARRAVQVAP